jgi:GNAT superfamily N-acetyltransferase
MPGLTNRLAQLDDLDALRALMARAIAHLQGDFLSPEQVRVSHHVMGLDTQLVRDQTYFLIERDGTPVGCGGWSWRVTLYGGDTSAVAREPAPLDPAMDAARIRAMYTDPAFARRGVGRLIMNLCEGAARAAGFRKVELMATLAGEPLYRACGYRPIEHILSAPIDGVSVPLIRMGKPLGGEASTGL